jgi:phage gpG-like protein
LDRVKQGVIVVSAGGPGVPYAAVHELGTKGKGGEIDTIVPKPPRQWLTIPQKDSYVGRRAGEFKGKLFFITAGNVGFLLERGTNEAAYLLVRRVDIKARPYLAPAAKDAAKDEVIAAQIREVFGQSKLPYEVTRV